MNKAERKPLANSLGPSMLAISGDACTQKLRSLLAQRRIKGRLTQGELAMRLGKVQSYIEKIEVGDHSLNIEDLIQISRALNTSSVLLLKEAIVKSYRL
ncbi:MAG: XRE family transcriptional regulator [Betaproteobacteria bacterium]|jgi:transcriptional regulator with XRE-family HTH domain|nr:XRE family transcriptional regulator [Betaproteobacteria bacterium]NBT98132.1 XRE family transcriptional regulator [Betaproteobacteria bacterium]NCX01749.1 XRE family transcriptional regulator [Betaproteobacteria bacterium]